MRELLRGLRSQPRLADPLPVECRDPFAVTCDPRLYVPRPASEAALARLEASVDAGAHCCVLSGPPGIGKTLLLRVLATRLAAEVRSVFLPYAALGLDDLCRWVLGLLEPIPRARAGDPRLQLLHQARQSGTRSRPLLLLLDDASALPRSTAHGLLELAGRARGGLRLVVVPVDDSRAGRVIAALGERVEHVRLATAMSEAETVHYVRQRLERCQAPPAIAARFDAATLRRLWWESGGNPRRLHALATCVLRSPPRTGGSAGPRAAVPGGPSGGPALELSPEDGTDLRPLEGLLRLPERG